MRTAFALVLLSAMSAAARGPDTFDPAKRDPAWLCEDVRRAKAERDALAAKETDDWLDRCALYLRESNRRAMAKSDDPNATGALEDSEKREMRRFSKQREDSAKDARDAEGLAGEDVGACHELEPGYYAPRRHLYERAYYAATGYPADERDRAEALALELFQRQFGAALVERLERHAPAFALASAEFSDGEQLEPSELIVASTFDPGVSPQERAKAAVGAALRYVASEDVLRRYVEVQTKLWVDPWGAFPRSATTRPFAPAVRLPPDPLTAALEWKQQRRRESAARRDAAEAAGLAPADLLLVERLFRDARDHRTSLGGGAGADFFVAHLEEFDRRLDAARTDATYRRWHPHPLAPWVAKGPLLRVSGVAPPTDDVSAAIHVRVENADRQAVLDCGDVFVVRGVLESPCLVAPAALAQKGRYRVSATFGATAPEATFDTDGSETRVDVYFDLAQATVAVTRVVAADRARLEADGPATSDRIAFRLVNDSKVPLVPGAATWADAIELQYDGRPGWVTSPEEVTVLVAGNPPLAPGAALAFEFGPRRTLSPVAIRSVVRLAGEGAPGVVVEVASRSAFGERPQPAGRPEACIAPPLSDDGGYRPEGFTDVLAAPAGFVSTHRDGIVRIDGTRLTTVFASKDALGEIAASEDGRLVATHGLHSVVVSRDGGATFSAVATDIADPGAVAVSGADVLVFGRDGRALRIGSDGAKAPIALPKAVSWMSASFDGARGVVSGACEARFLTRDGGRTWGAAPAPRGAFAMRGAELVVASKDGLLSSRDDGVTFSTLSDRHCFGLRRRGERLFAICPPDGDTRTPLLVSTSGGPFVPLPSELPLRVSGMDVDAAGRIVAVGADDVLLAGDATGVQQKLETVVAKKAVLATMRRTFQASLRTRSAWSEPPKP